MRRVALSNVLRDLPMRAGVSNGKLSPDARRAIADEPSQQLADAASEAYQLGLAEGRRKALAEIEQLLAEARMQAEELLERERAFWITGLTAELEAKLAEGLQHLEAELSEAVGRCLYPIVREFACAEAVDQLLSGIRGMLSVSKDVTIVVEGPERLLKALAERLDRLSISYRMVPTTGADIKVQVGSTSIVTRLEGLLAGLEELVE